MIDLRTTQDVTRDPVRTFKRSDLAFGTERSRFITEKIEGEGDNAYIIQTIYGLSVGEQSRTTVEFIRIIEDVQPLPYVSTEEAMAGVHTGGRYVHIVGDNWLPLQPRECNKVKHRLSCDHCGYPMSEALMSGDDLGPCNRALA